MSLMPEENKMEKIDLSDRKILFILPLFDFCDEEYQKPKNLFNEWGARIVVASSSLATAKGRGVGKTADHH